MAKAYEAAGADVVQLADAIGHGDRMGRITSTPDLGFGGGFLPKDIRDHRRSRTVVAGPQAAPWRTVLLMTDLPVGQGARPQTPGRAGPPMSKAAAVVASKWSFWLHRRGTEPARVSSRWCNSALCLSLLKAHPSLVRTQGDHSRVAIPH